MIKLMVENQTLAEVKNLKTAFELAFIHSFSNDSEVEICADGYSLITVYNGSLINSASTCDECSELLESLYNAVAQHIISSAFIWLLYQIFGESNE